MHHGKGLQAVDNTCRAALTALLMHAGHKVEAAKMDCALTPSDVCVLSGSEDGESLVPSSSPQPCWLCMDTSDH